MCAEAGGYQGWCLCRKSVVGSGKPITDKNGNQWWDGEIQMWPVRKSIGIIDPWHYKKYYWIFDIRIIKEVYLIIKKYL